MVPPHFLLYWLYFLLIHFHHNLNAGFVRCSILPGDHWVLLCYGAEFGTVICQTLIHHVCNNAVDSLEERRQMVEIPHRERKLFYLPIYPSIYLSAFLSSIYLPIYPFINPVYLSIHLSIQPSIYASLRWCSNKSTSAWCLMTLTSPAPDADGQCDAALCSCRWAWLSTSRSTPLCAVERSYKEGETTPEHCTGGSLVKILHILHPEQENLKDRTAELKKQ